jgi:Fic family protein
MELIPLESIQINKKKIEEIDGLIQKIYRLIIYSRIHYDDDLLDAYVAGVNDLKTLLSIKNAQMEAQTEEEAKRYLLHLNNAIDFVFEEISRNQSFDREGQLYQLFRLISPEAHAVHPNRYRDTLVQVGEHLCPEPERVPQLMSELFYKLESIPNTIVRAIYFHHEFVRIHPFVDGNGRVARIAKNWILMHDMYPPIFINDISVKTQYLSMLGHSFKQLLNYPKKWNNFTAAFFDQEIDLIIQNTTMLYEKINKIGLRRMN